MIQFWSRVLLLATACILVAGQADAQDKGKAKPKPKPSKRYIEPTVTGDIEKDFKKLDTNRNWELSLEEFKAGKPNEQQAEKEFRALDRDGNGRVTLGEFNIGMAKKSPPAEPPKEKPGGQKKDKPKAKPKKK